MKKLINSFQTDLNTHFYSSVQMFLNKNNDMNWIKKIFKKQPNIIHSNIITYVGNKYDLSKCYDDLIHRSDIEITSVSITRVDSDGSKGYVDNYMIAISYKYEATLKKVSL